MLGQLIALVRKETQQTLRDMRMMVLLVLAPLVQTVVFGLAVDFETNRIPTAIIDQDDSVESRTLSRRLLADDTLVLTRSAPSPEQADAWLIDDVVDLVVVIPEDFGKDIVRGRSPTVQALVDGTDPNRSAAAQSYVAGLISASASGPMISASASGPMQGRGPELVVPKIYLNPGLDTAPYMLPGVAGVLLLLITTIVSSMGLARERETGTLEQLRVTPIPGAIVLLGKVLPFAVVGFVDFVFALSIAHFGFGMPLRGSFANLAAICAVYLAGTLSTGLAVSTFSRTQQQAFLGGFLVLLPFALLSGVFTPIESMPAWLQWLTFGNPLRHFAALVRGNAFAAQSLGEATESFVALVVYALIVGSLAVYRFSRIKE